MNACALVRMLKKSTPWYKARFPGILLAAREAFGALTPTSRTGHVVTQEGRWRRDECVYKLFKTIPVMMYLKQFFHT